MNCLAGYKIAAATAHFMYLHSLVLLSKCAKHYTESKASYSKQYSITLHFPFHLAISVTRRICQYSHI
jgi:hypothetical protein